MRSLPLIVPDGCTLSADGLADQAGQAARLLPSVANVDRSEDVLQVSFREGVDVAHDARGREVVRQLAEFFVEGR